MSELAEFQVTLEKMVYGGEALGRLPDGRAVFVPFALPGETVRVRLVEEKRGFARAELLEVVSPSERRITPRCKHFSVCGGCHYQHIPYEMQLEAKAEILRDQLTRIGKLEDPPVRPTVPSPQSWFYRNHVQFHQDEDGALGYLAADPHQLVRIEECFLPVDPLNALWPQLDMEPLPELARIGLRAGAETEELMVVLESAADEPVDFSVDFPIAAVQLGPEEVHILSDSYHFHTQVLDRTFRVSAGAFFQVNVPAAALMVEHLLENLPLAPDSVVIDVYCGVGLFSAFLAPRVGRLIGVESDPAAAADFEVNLDEFDDVEIYEAPAEIALPAMDVSPDVILVDPPRAGVHPKALDAIVAMQPGFLAYVSCDPATLGRDAKRLTQAGYILKQVTPFDLFPQTYHIESVSFWERA